MSLLAFPLFAQTRKQLEKELEFEFKNKEFTLLQTPNYSGSLYLTIGTNELICQQSYSGLFPKKTDVYNVKISSIDTVSETETFERTAPSKEPGKAVLIDRSRSKTTVYWRFKLQHKYLGKGEIRLTTADGEIPDQLPLIKSALVYVLSGPILPSPRRFCGNANSKKVHFVGSGHIPNADSFVDFASEEEAISAGYTPCVLCFRESTVLSMVPLENLLGRETESQLRGYYGISPDKNAVNRIKAVGAKILANWPEPLKGYKYRYCVLDDDSYNACACPGGYIFVHSGLLEILENEDELEAVLAHQIAHVEQRHGLKEYLKLQRDANSAAIAGLIVAGTAGAVAASSGNPRTSL